MKTPHRAKPFYREFYVPPEGIEGARILAGYKGLRGIRQVGMVPPRVLIPLHDHAPVIGLNPARTKGHRDLHEPVRALASQLLERLVDRQPLDAGASARPPRQVLDDVQGAARLDPAQKGAAVRADVVEVPEGIISPDP